MRFHLFTLKNFSPLHSGIGQGLNDIDLPTARNPVSGHPVIPGSSLKGVLKEEYLQGNYGKDVGGTDKKKISEALFGRDGNEFASAISMGDANLLALPVRSYYGTFSYLASPYTLQQIKEELLRQGRTDIPEIPDIGLQEGSNPSYKVFITGDSLLKISNNDYILLEEMDLRIDSQGAALAEQWAALIAPLYFDDEEGQAIFKRRFAITDDNVLNFFCETGLPVDARIAIDQKTGTVKPGALWYEESVPPETLFYGMVAVDRSYASDVQMDEEVMSDFLTGEQKIYCQVGGKATTGKGFVAIDFRKAGE